MVKATQYIVMLNEVKHLTVHKDRDEYYA